MNKFAKPDALLQATRCSRAAFWESQAMSRFGVRSHGWATLGGSWLRFSEGLLCLSSGGPVAGLI